MSENLQLVLFVVTVIGSLFSCGAAVASFLFSRRPASVELQSQVEELAMVAEKILKTQRKEKMTRVRNAATENPDDHRGDIASGDPQLVNVPSGYTPSKIALIQAARQKGFRV